MIQGSISSEVESAFSIVADKLPKVFAWLDFPVNAAGEPQIV
jgi:hypothetical protein